MCYHDGGDVVLRVEQLQLPNGEEPFGIWVATLEVKARAKIYAFIDRVSAGGSRKNVKTVGNGVFEVKIDYGPGYRVYFGEFEKDMILLLLGGDKRMQRKDIAKACEYWRHYVQKQRL